MAFEHTTDYANYDEVPFFRKRWFFVLSVLFCTPVGLVVAFSGDVYALHKGQVSKFPKNTRVMIAVVWSVLLCLNLLRALR